MGAGIGQAVVAIAGHTLLQRCAPTESVGRVFALRESLLSFGLAVGAVIAPPQLHVGRSLRKVVRRGEFELRFDTAFAAVIAACATTPRRGETGTWIVPEMIEAYTRLHEAGYAHSVETYKEGVLCGGLYGVSLGGCFFGESMFSRADDASKVAFVALAERLVSWGFELIDGQLQNPHLDRFGLEVIPRAEFMLRLRRALRHPTRVGRWT